MRKGFRICTILTLASLSLATHGHRPPSGSVPGNAHSNAPSGPAAGEERLLLWADKTGAGNVRGRYSR